MRPASLPMYDADRPAVGAFWRGIAGHLRRLGVFGVPDEPLWPGDLVAHWLDPRLLLSQACGHPLVTSLDGRVQLVGAFHYDVPGCSGSDYCSVLVVRDGDPAQSIEDLRGRVAAVNSPDSHSGCNALRAFVAPLAREGRFFARAVLSGSHRASTGLVRAGHADIAAIDAVTWAALPQHGLRAIGLTAPAPGLPLITASETSPPALAALRQALEAAVADPALDGPRRALRIAAFEVLPLAAYDRIAGMRDASAALAREWP